MTGRLHHLAMGGLVTLALCLGVAWLAASPSWRSLPENAALLRLSFTHGAKRICRDRTPEELAGLPRNMRQTKVCERRRPPVVAELDIDGKTVFADELEPSGLAGGGPSRVYRRFVLAAGDHEIAARLRDNPQTDGFNYTASKSVTLKPGQSFVVDFRPTEGGFVFH